MSRRSSLRAQAQEIFCAEKSSALASRDLTAQSPAGQSLTEKVRALYEGSAVPVAEIARLAGVTERTIYKYARKGNWKPRYAWNEEGARPQGRNARTRRTALRPLKRAQRFAPVKGAGGRFIRRADKDKPYAVGLKATDPAAAARAAAACEKADALARAAEEDAARAHWQEERLRAWRAVNRAAGKLAQFRETLRKKAGARNEAELERLLDADPLGRVLKLTLAAALDWLEALPLA